ncbi:hypothetical protein GC194_07325 [bacterium]|nr:hypothetical protein [bacterium]
MKKTILLLLFAFMLQTLQAQLWQNILVVRGSINAMADDGYDLIIGGSFSEVNNESSYRWAFYNGVQINAGDWGIGGIACLNTYAGDIYAGIINTGEIFKWNGGTWIQTIELPISVYCISDINDTMFAAGSMGRIYSIVNGVFNLESTFYATDKINRMVNYKGIFIAAGNFNTYGPVVARYNGKWKSLDQNLPISYVQDMLVFNDKLVLVGYYNNPVKKHRYASVLLWNGSTVEHKSRYNSNK